VPGHSRLSASRDETGTQSSRCARNALQIEHHDSGMALDRVRAAELAALQHGTVTTRQLIELGASRSQLSRMQAAGLVHHRYQTVWCWGHQRLSDKGEWSAAVLAAGEGSALAGHAAASFWRIGRRRRSSTIEVATPNTRRRRRPGIRLMKVAELGSRSVEIDGIRVLTVTWTLALLAAEIPKGELVRMISQAAYRRVLDLNELLHVAHDGSRRPGGPRLREALRAYLEGEHGSDSHLEERVVAWLPDPAEDPLRQNVYVSGDGWEYRVDILYERMRVVVEPGGPHHERPVNRRRDRIRWRRLRAAGWTVFPVRQEDFDRDPYGAVAPAREAVAGWLARQCDNAAAECCAVRHTSRSGVG
jgi:hypothetical protein